MIMAILKPDSVSSINGVKVNEYLLTKHNPNHIDMPNIAMNNVIGVTIHNTDWISVASVAKKFSIHSKKKGISAIRPDPFKNSR